MEHEHYMDIKFLISIWERDIEDGNKLSNGERWALKKFFMKMNSQQRYDTMDGQGNIRQVLKEEGLINNDWKITFEDPYKRKQQEKEDDSIANRIAKHIRTVKEILK